MNVPVAIFLVISLVICIHGSSHSEAPGTAQTPSADITDFYMFQSYESGRSGYTTFLMNVYPLQNPFGGPNYFSFSDEHFYEINIDTNGDGVQDYIYQFIYGNALGGNATTVNSDPDYDEGDNCNSNMPYDHTVHLGITLPIGPPGATQNVAVPLKFVGPVTFANQGALNWFEYYQLQVITGNRNSTISELANITGTTNSYINKPFDYVGTKTFGNASSYESYSRSFITQIDLPGCDTATHGASKVWAGQRLESFHINIGKIFDLVNLTPLSGGIAECDSNNALNSVNIGTFALEVPTACLTAGGNTVVGAWATVRLLQHTPMNVSNGHAPGKQTSRLGNPLVNELLIGLPDKDKWSTLDPVQDNTFLSYFQYPTLPEILNILFRVALGSATDIAPSLFPRPDLVEVFLTGIPTLNGYASGAPMADLMRLNTSVPAVSQANQNHYGVIGGDVAGYPNGRRPGDDVVDITLRVAMGVLLTAAQAPVGNQNFTDGAPLNAGYFNAYFPYLTTPLPGATTDPNPLTCAGAGGSTSCPSCPTCNGTSTSCPGSAANLAIYTSLLLLIISMVLLF